LEVLHIQYKILHISQVLKELR